MKSLLLYLNLSLTLISALKTLGGKTNWEAYYLWMFEVDEPHRQLENLSLHCATQLFEHF